MILRKDNIMAKIFVIIGKSGSGKSSVYNKLFEESRRNNIRIRSLVVGTTRPKRSTDLDSDYEFVTDDEFIKMYNDNLIAESRRYKTVSGTWTYFTKYNPSIHIEPSNTIYLTINTIEGFLGLCSTYGDDNVYPIYIKAPSDDVRLQRLVDRERKQDKPNYLELYRRFAADDKDFSEGNLAFAKVSVENQFRNDRLTDTVQAVVTRIAEIVSGHENYVDKFTEYLDRLVVDVKDITMPSDKNNFSKKYLTGNTNVTMLECIKSNYAKYIKRCIPEMVTPAKHKTPEQLSKLFGLANFSKHSSNIIHVYNPFGTIGDNKHTFTIDVYRMIDGEVCTLVLREKLSCANESYKPFTISWFDEYYVNHYITNVDTREYSIVYLNVPMTIYNDFINVIKGYGNTLPIHNIETGLDINIDTLE